MNVSATKGRIRQSNPLHDAARFGLDTGEIRTIGEEPPQLTGEINDPDVNLKGGDLFMSKVTFPDEVAPGGTVDVEVTVGNGGSGIDLLDPDRCGPRPTRGGLKTITRVVPEWGDAKDRQACILFETVGARFNTFAFSFRAPTSEGSYRMDAELETGGSGQSGSVSFQIQVDRDAGERPGECTSDEDCIADRVCENGQCVSSGGGGGGGGPILPCFLDPNRACSTFETVGFTAVAVLILLVAIR